MSTETVTVYGIDGAGARGAAKSVSYTVAAPQWTPPRRGANTPNGLAAAQKRWPTVGAFRTFFGDVPFASIAVPSVSLFCPSFKTADVDGFAAGAHDADLEAFRQKVRAAGVRVRVADWHEADHKINTGTLPMTFAQWYAIQQRGIAFFAGDPLVEWSVIITANLLVNADAQGHVAEDYLPPGLVSLGVDFDGSRPTKLPYVDYGPHTARLAALKARYGFDVWVPEFGVPEVPADLGGTSRATWITHILVGLDAIGAAPVIAFDTAPEGPFDSAGMAAFVA